MGKTAAVVALFMAVLTAAPAWAQAEGSVVIDIVLTRYGDPGEVVFVRDVPVDADLVGATCTATARTENNTSEHPDNDFLLTSGGATGVIPDFEAVAGQVTSMTSTLVLGDTITAEIRLGPDGVTSEGVLVTLLCSSQPPPTTQPPATTTTTQPPADTTTTQPPPVSPSTTQPAGPSTTETPPVGGVEAGGGAAAGGAGSAAPLVGGGALALAAGLGLLALAQSRRRPW